MTSGKDFIIGHAASDLVLARLKHLGALEVVWELESGGDIGIFIRRRRSEQRGVLNSSVSFALWIPPHHKLVTPLPYTSFYHTLLCNVFSIRSPLVAGVNLCLGCRWSRHTFGPALCQGMASWGCVRVVLLLMPLPENWSISRGAKALLMHLLLAGDHGRHPGRAPSGNFELSLFCGPCDRRRGCMVHGWFLHFRSELSERVWIKKSCFSLCPWSLGCFRFSYYLS